MGYNITIFTFKLGIIISILIVILLLGSSLVNSFQNRESLGGFILNFSNIAVFVLAVLFGMFFWQYAKGIDKYILNEENKVKSEAEKLYWESRLAEVRYLKELGLDVSKDEALRKKHVDLVFKRERKNR